MRKTAAMLFLLGIVSPCSVARTYYVDSQNGNDANDASSATSAWKTLAKVNASRFAPGDIILLRRGGVWREQLNLLTSGTAQSPITIDSYGSGALPLINGADQLASTSWSQCSSCHSGVWQSPVATQPNVVIFNSQKGNRQPDLYRVANAGDWFWEAGTLYVFSEREPSGMYQGAGIEFGVRPMGINLTGASFIIVRNVEVTAANAIPYGEGAGIWASTFHLSGPTPNHLLISHVTVTNCAGDGVHIENSDGSTVESSLIMFNDGAGIKLSRNNDKFPINSGTIRDNEIHHNRSDGVFLVGCPRAERCRSVVHPDGLIVSGIKITGNRVHHNGAGIYLHQTNDSLVAGNVAYSNKDTSQRGEGYCVGVSGSSNNIIEKNECYDARLSGIELSIDTGRPPFGSSNNTVRYNLVHDDGTHGIFSNYTPSQNNKILYNLIYNHPNGSCIMANYIGHEIYNNTCYNSRLGIHLYVSSSTRQTGHISIKNNIIVNSSEFHVLIEPGVDGPLDFANNDYYPDGARRFNWRGVISGFDQWRSSTHLDANSLTENPQFVSSSPRNGPDFALRRGSPAIGKGMNLGKSSEIALSPTLSWPKQVNLLPQNGDRWDMGAIRHP